MEVLVSKSIERKTMIDKDEVLKSIQLEGAANEDDSTIKVIIASRNNLDKIIELSSGNPRIRQSVINKFKLLLAQPIQLKALSPLAIRCCLCMKPISYPAWHFSQSYSTNHFHFFVCFDYQSPTVVTSRCYKINRSNSSAPWL